jgi:GT2 family glycosyltransferase
MRARVTAVLIASNGADFLPRTLAALEAQIRQPDILIVVDAASTDSSAALLAGIRPTHFVSATGAMSFGTAVTHALGVMPPPASNDEWLWLLAHDTAPEPGALAAMLATVEVSPSVAVAGPKQMDWDAPGYIREFGETVTEFGATFSLAETELDQAQYDRMSDVLAVGAAGMLVRHTVFNELHGFDPALPTADNGLDFSIRVRLAGHRVVGVPAARIASGGTGLAGPGWSQKGRARRQRHADSRAAQLHRRLVYAPTFAVFFHWISLVPLAALRSLGQLVRKQPGVILGEFSAAFRTAFGSHIRQARSNFKRTRRVGWRAITPLRIAGDEVRRRRSLQREIALARLRGEPDRIQFIATGGVTTALTAAIVGLIVFIPLFGAKALTGGSLLPLSPSAADLWANVGFGWRDIGLGFVGAADPFSAVLAVLGSLVFWSPSTAIVALYLAALPLAALAAWFLAARLTEKPWLRTVAAALWVLAPPFLAALDSGALGAIIAHLVLPWLVLAGLAARKSWSASAMAAILFAVTVAAAPSLWPGLLLLWLVMTVTSGRMVGRVVGIPIPALVMIAPLAWQQFRAGNLLALLADPGAPAPRGTVGLIELLSGIPVAGQAGWASIAAGLGMDSSVLRLVLVVVIIPLAALAVLALFLPGPSSTRAIGGGVIALVGLLTGIGATHLALTTVGDSPVFIWAGSGLSLYWLGLTGAAVIGLHTLKRGATVPGFVTVLVVAVVAVPLLAAPLLGAWSVKPGTGALLPALVTAEAAATPRVGTLVITPQSDGGLLARVVSGTGETLDDQSTQGQTGGITESTSLLATLVANLASPSGSESSAQLSELGIEFILLSPSTESVTGPLSETAGIRSTSALDGNASLTKVGNTFAGTLWQITGTPGTSSLPVAAPTNVGTPTGVIILTAQGVVFLLMLLLALPAGRLQPASARVMNPILPVSRRGAVAAEEVEPEELEPEELADDALSSAAQDPELPDEPEPEPVAEAEPASEADAEPATDAEDDEYDPDAETVLRVPTAVGTTETPNSEGENRGH